MRQLPSDGSDNGKIPAHLVRLRLHIGKRQAGLHRHVVARRIELPDLVETADGQHDLIAALVWHLTSHQPSVTGLRHDRDASLVAAAPGTATPARPSQGAIPAATCRNRGRASRADKGVAGRDRSRRAPAPTMAVSFSISCGVGALRGKRPPSAVMGSSFGVEPRAAGSEIASSLPPANSLS